MGSGASKRSKYEASSAQVDAMSQKLQQQSDQIAQLVTTQHQLCTQLSVLTARLQQQGTTSPNGQHRITSALGLAVADNFAMPNALKLVPAVQIYEWGKPWANSLVAKLCEASGQKLDRGLPYAEMWMGTHPNGPSKVHLEDSDGVSKVTVGLKETIHDNPEYWLGRDSARGNLPYLLKVLSVSQALSIQAHPHKKLAEFLHDRYPDRYKDANHKPEICLPLGDFEALVGFRKLDTIRKHVTEVKELRAILGEKLQLCLKDLYSRLMRSDPELIKQQIGSLVHRLSRRTEADLTPEEKLVLRLNKDYPGDVGILSVYFLNYVRITADVPDRFIFCAPDEPHAYLWGDCVECMSLSDNVVRAGLTPKFKDVETLLDMMTYRDDHLDTLVSTGQRVNSKVVLYNPPVDDFMVYEVKGGGPCEALLLPRASICICVSGLFSIDFNGPSSQIEQVSEGQSFFCRASTRLTVIDSKQGSRLYVASY